MLNKSAALALLRAKRRSHYLYDRIRRPAGHPEFVIGPYRKYPRGQMVAVARRSAMSLIVGGHVRLADRNPARQGSVPGLRWAYTIA